jgi:hypothetical protein
MDDARMPQQTPSNPMDAKIGTLRAQDLSMRDIAATVGMSLHAVAHRIRKPDLRSYIQRLSEELARQTAETIVKNHVLAVQAANRVWQEIAAQGTSEDAARLASQAKDLLEMADKKEKRAGQSMGIFPTPGTNVFLQNVFHGPANVIMSDEVARLIGNATRAMLQDGDDPEDGDIIDLALQDEDATDY